MSLVATKTIEQWVIGSEQVTNTTVTIKSGVVAEQYEVLMMEVATGKVIAYDKVKVGTDIVAYIAPEALDATTGDMDASVITGGRFNKDLAVFATAPSDAQKASAFAGTPISLDSLFKG